MDALTVSIVGLGHESGQFEIISDFKYKDIKFLYPRLWINLPSKVEYSFPKEIEFLVKFFGPYRKLSLGTDSPPEYSYLFKEDIFKNSSFISLSGWGSNSGGSFIVGEHLVEVWVNGKLIGSKTFRVIN